MPNIMQKLIKSVCGNFTKSEHSHEKYASFKTDRILKFQEEVNTTRVNDSYAEAGFKAKTLTSIMVQNQIAMGI
jgi:hypothetical protein